MAELDVAELIRDLVLNLVSLFVLVYLIYYRQHRRREQAIGYVAFNVSLFTVAAALGSSNPLNVGAGFGLFAVLSIVRLRSDESSQTEIGYTMIALVLGLMTGLPEMEFHIKIIFAILLIATMIAVDSPFIVRRKRCDRVGLEIDRVITDPAELLAHVAKLLQAPIHNIEVRRIDFVRETMSIYAVAEFSVPHRVVRAI